MIETMGTKMTDKKEWSILIMLVGNQAIAPWMELHHGAEKDDSNNSIQEGGWLSAALS